MIASKIGNKSGAHVDVDMQVDSEKQPGKDFGSGMTCKPQEN
ncbi:MULTISPECIES: hypothetical protein [unclassified Methanosarcina]|nr:MULTISPECIES: hypothetical protein [unclassified Methanosarcina]